jgi:hypothetical protein
MGIVFFRYPELFPAYTRHFKNWLREYAKHKVIPFKIYRAGLKISVSECAHIFILYTYIKKIFLGTCMQFIYTMYIVYIYILSTYLYLL